MAAEAADAPAAEASSEADEPADGPHDAAGTVRCNEEERDPTMNVSAERAAAPNPAISAEASEPSAPARRFRTVWAVLGFVAFALGAVGVVIPVFPTTPFVLVAAFYFARSGTGCGSWRCGLVRLTPAACALGGLRVRQRANSRFLARRHPFAAAILECSNGLSIKTCT